LSVEWPKFLYGTESMLPKLCRHRSKGRAYVTLPGKKVVYLGAWPDADGPPPPDVVAQYKVIVGRLLTDQPPLAEMDGRVSVEELVGLFLESQRDSIDFSAYRGALYSVLILYGSIPAEEFGPNKLRAVQEYLVKTPTRGKPRTRSGINITLRRIRRCWSWGVSRELVPESVSRALGTVDPLRLRKSSAPESKPRKAVDPEVVEKTVPFLPPHIVAMIRLQQLTAMRPGEVTQITTGEIDRRQKGAWFICPEQHKNAHRGKGRAIALGPKAIEIITPWLRADPEKPIFSPAERVVFLRETQRAKRKSKVPPSQEERKVADPKRKPGESYDTRSYGRAIMRVCQREGIEVWSPNQLRKLAINLAANRGGKQRAQAFAGHLDSETTERFYLEQDRQLAAEAANLVEGR